MAGFDIIENQLLGLTTSFPYINSINPTRVCTFSVLLVNYKDFKQKRLNKYIAYYTQYLLCLRVAVDFILNFIIF